MTGNLFDQPQPARAPVPKRVYGTGGVVAEHARMNRQRQIAERNERMGEPTGKTTIDARFRAFHAANPQVYARLVALAREMRQKRANWGIRPLVEIVRYEHAIATTGDDGFKINNDFCSRYARLIMETEIDLAGFFETRELKAL